MAHGTYSNSQIDQDNCCVAGFIYTTCTHCGGHPRQMAQCKRCNGSGSIGCPCPIHAAYVSTGYVSTNNPPAYGGGNAGYGANSGYGQQQGYGSTSKN